jgi:hypothetical protein
MTWGQAPAKPVPRSPAPRDVLENRRGPPSNEGEVGRALHVAAESYRSRPGDDERAARAVSAALGWSLARARWCIDVNRDWLQEFLSDPGRGS